MWCECEDCEIQYFTAEGHWEDELYCFACYHISFPCPPWCPDRSRMKPIQIYTVRALDEFGRLYNNSYAFGYLDDLKLDGIASLIMQKLVWPILKKMGEDARAEWDCYLHEFGGEGNNE